jgi:hypothetical protein
LLSARRFAPPRRSTTIVANRVHRAVFMDWISVDRGRAERRDRAKPLPTGRCPTE